MGKKILIIYICNCTEKGWGRLLAHYASDHLEESGVKVDFHI